MTKLHVLYEDNHLIAVNKQVSDLVQGDKTGDETLPDKIGRYLKEKYNKPGNVFVGVVHRLDRPVSGVVMFSRTSKALSRLNEMFKNKTQVTKTYWAIVQDKPKQASGELKHFLFKDQSKNKSFICNSSKQGSKEAILNYKILASSDRYHLLEINLQTGRHHQIRVQLSNMGCVIKGDLKYGANRSNPDGGISLHARYLSVMHPVKKEELKIEAPVPNDPLWKYFEKHCANN